MSYESDLEEDRTLNSVAAGSQALNFAGPYGQLAALLISGGIYGYKAYRQNDQAKKLSKTGRPEYEIPPAVREAVNLARLQAANSKLPGQNLMEQKLDNTTSRGLAELKNVSTNPSQLAANAAKLYSYQQDAQNNLNIAGAQNYNNNQAMLRGQLGQLGQYQDKQWDYNKFQPYVNDMAASSALREGAFRNATAAGINTATGIGNLAALRYAQNQMNPSAQGVALDSSAGIPSPEQEARLKQAYPGGLPAAINGSPSVVNSPTTTQNEFLIKQLQDFYAPKNTGGYDFNDPRFNNYNYK